MTERGNIAQTHAPGRMLVVLREAAAPDSARHRQMAAESRGETSASSITRPFRRLLENGDRVLARKCQARCVTTRSSTVSRVSCCASVSQIFDCDGGARVAGPHDQVVDIKATGRVSSFD